ncbi:MAG: response regulator [Elusimicrobia bacterium]|nr:response regulator [Elusimicrobiota bacterium]
MKILIADDDPSMRKLLNDALSLAGCEVIQAETGRQAIDLAKQATPDLILLDHTMPEMKGYDAMKEIRKEPALAQVPVVLITGNFEVQGMAEDDKLERCAFLPKPYSIDQLMTTIGVALGRPFP